MPYVICFFHSRHICMYIYMTGVFLLHHLWLFPPYGFSSTYLYRIYSGALSGCMSVFLLVMYCDIYSRRESDITIYCDYF